jgi:hypothetical protein
MKVSLEDQGSSSFRAKVWESGDPSPPGPPVRLGDAPTRGVWGHPRKTKQKSKVNVSGDPPRQTDPTGGSGIPQLGGAFPRAPRLAVVWVSEGSGQPGTSAFPSRAWGTGESECLRFPDPRLRVIVPNARLSARHLQFPGSLRRCAACSRPAGNRRCGAAGNEASWEPGNRNLSGSPLPL